MFGNAQQQRFERRFLLAELLFQFAGLGARFLRLRPSSAFSSGAASLNLRADGVALGAQAVDLGLQAGGPRRRARSARRDRASTPLSRIARSTVARFVPDEVHAQAWARQVRELRFASGNVRLTATSMPSGLIALLDDVATIAKLAASSLDDVGAAAGKASTKAAGVVIDDTAVTPRYVIGLAPERELPIIGKIAWGSLKNKILFLLPAALLLTAFAPVPDHAVADDRRRLSRLRSDREDPRGSSSTTTTIEEQLVDAMDDPRELEKLQVKGAIRTDFILSAEIMAIALASLDHLDRIGTTAIALVAVALAITAGVYGVVALDREARRYRPAHGRAAQRDTARNRQGAGPGRPEAAERLCRRSAPRRCCGSAAEFSSTASKSCTS